MILSTKIKIYLFIIFKNLLLKSIILIINGKKIQHAVIMQNMFKSIISACAEWIPNLPFLFEKITVSCVIDGAYENCGIIFSEMKSKTQS